MKRALSFVAATAAAYAAMLLIVRHPILQSEAYHHFADQRTLIPGIPNTLDVLSNAGFLLAGAIGLVRFARSATEAVYFAGAIATAIGSAYYHLHPNDGTLIYDRIGIMIAFMAYFALVIEDRVTPAAPMAWLGALEILGIASVFWWRNSGDLRPYGFAQFYPFLAIPVLLVATRGRRAGAKYVWSAMACYAVAKLCEQYDLAIFERLVLVSGHTLKHLIAAAGMWMAALWIGHTGTPDAARRAVV